MLERVHYNFVSLFLFVFSCVGVVPLNLLVIENFSLI